MATNKGSLGNSNKAILLLIGLTVVYQIVYHLIMRQIISDNEHTEDPCDTGLVGSSHQCVEAQLFQSWKTADQEFHNGLLQITHTEISTPTPTSAKSLRASATEPPQPVPQVAKSQDDSMHPCEKLLSRAERHACRQAEIDRLYEETLASIKQDNTSSQWRHKLEAEEALLHDMNEHLPSTQRAHVQERIDKFDKLFNDTMSILEHEPAITPYAAGIEKFLNEVVPTSTVVEIEHEVGHSAPLFQKVYQFGSKLCESTQYKLKPSCAYFNDSSYGHARSPKVDMKHTNSGIVDIMASHGKDLCADPDRSSSVACAHYSATASSMPAQQHMTLSANASAAPSRSLRGAEANKLTWDSSVMYGRKHGKRGGKGHTMLERDALRGLEWQGKVPSVACVTVVHSHFATRSRLEYFVANFHQQTFTGNSKLMLVFNSADFEVGKLVRSFADGTRVFAVGAWEADKVFPSSRSFRYGAWGVDTDIVARWNFDEWHHPDQLEMQIRAMAVATRPVSLLKRWSALEARDTHGTPGFSQKILSDTIGWYGSIIGEASWMRDHWMPAMADERSMLASVQSKDIVHVDMPELSVYNNATSHTWKDVLSHFDLLNPAKIATIQVCYSVSNVTWSADTTIGDNEYAIQIQVKLGQEMGATYDLLADQRHQVAKSLRDMCEEAERAPKASRGTQWFDAAAGLAQLHRNLEDVFNRIHELVRSS